MRYISFALTPDQVERQIKTVTRRTGWATAKVGQVLRPARKCQGIKKGEKVQPLGTSPIRLVRIDREWMSDFLNRPDAAEECAREGFPDMTPQEFYGFFMRTHHAADADDLLVTRLEFVYEVPR